MLFVNLALAAFPCPSTAGFAWNADPATDVSAPNAGTLCPNAAEPLCAPHKVRTPSNAEQEPLVVWLPGSGEIPGDHPWPQAISTWAGYKTIGLSYDSEQWVAIECPPQATNSNCHFEMRKDRITGRGNLAAFPTIRDVPPEDSIRWRLYDLLEELHNADNTAGWDAYYVPVATPGDEPKSQNIVWDKIIMAGFSQGAGHAALIAKRRDLKGAVLIEGPLDVYTSGGVITRSEWIADAAVNGIATDVAHIGVAGHLRGGACNPLQLDSWTGLGLGDCTSTFDNADLGGPFSSLRIETDQTPACGGLFAPACPSTRYHASMSVLGDMPTDAVAANPALITNPHLTEAYLHLFCEVGQ